MHSCLLLCPLIVDEIDVSSPASIAAELFFASQNGRTPAMMHGRSIDLSAAANLGHSSAGQCDPR
jgi:hypothetical protein